jgi:hypothetical protein
MIRKPLSLDFLASLFLRHYNVVDIVTPNDARTSFPS